MGSAAPQGRASHVVRDGSAVHLVREWVAVAGVAFVLYALTANRGAQWQDCGFFILSIVKGELINPLGLALTHPLHHWLGRLAIRPGVLEPSFAITLVSSLGAAVAVANVFGCVRALTDRRSAALWAAASLAMAHTFWKLATVTEVYTLSAALLAGECWCLIGYLRTGRRGHLWGALLLNGLGIGNHLQATLMLPVWLGVVAWGLAGRRLRWTDVAAGVLLWLAGTLPYSGLVAVEMVQGGDWKVTLGSALFGAAGLGYAGNVFNLAVSGRVLAVSGGFTLLSFPNLLLPAAVYGLTRWRALGLPGGLRWALAGGLILHAGFACRYDVVDQYTFFLPAYVLTAILGGAGAAGVLAWAESSRRRRGVWAAMIMLAATPLVYATAPAIAERIGVLEGVARHKPYRNDYVYLFTPWSVVERSAERMGSEAVALAGAVGAVLVDDPMGRPAVPYHALRSGWTDLAVMAVPADEPARVGELARRLAASGRRVVLVPASVTREPPAEVAWRRVGDLYVAE